MENWQAWLQTHLISLPKPSRSLLESCRRRSWSYSVSVLHCWFRSGNAVDEPCHSTVLLFCKLYRLRSAETTGSGNDQSAWDQVHRDTGYGIELDRSRTDIPRNQSAKLLRINKSNSTHFFDTITTDRAVLDRCVIGQLAWHKSFSLLDQTSLDLHVLG